MCVTLIMLTFLTIELQQNQQQGSKSATENSAIESIEKLLTAQVQSWNNKDLEAFMATYWKSPNLTFSAGGKTTRGWQQTLERYQAKYPPEKMGALNFDKLEVSLLSKEVAMVLGTWELTWPEEGAGKEDSGKSSKGNFSLVLKKIDKQWKIIHDHSSSLEE